MGSALPALTPRSLEPCSSLDLPGGRGAQAAAPGPALPAGCCPGEPTPALCHPTRLLPAACRVPQIAANLRSRGTGQLSLITYGLNTAGAAARIFTSVQERAGAAMLRGALIGACVAPAPALPRRCTVIGRFAVQAAVLLEHGALHAKFPAHPFLARTPCLLAAPTPSCPPAAATLLNGLLAAQIVYYRGGGGAKNAGRRGKKKAT